MTENGRPCESLPANALKRIDEVCTRFEAAWGAGQAPHPEDFLGDAEGDERAAWAARPSTSWRTSAS